MSDPKVIETEKLQSYGIYYGFGGYVINSSSADSHGNRHISGQMVDIPKAPWGYLFPKLIRAIS
jgi:hypothetical protein